MKVKGFGINAAAERIDGNLEILKNDLKFFEEVGYAYVEIPVHGLDLIINGELNRDQLKKVKNVIIYFNLKFTVHAPDKLNLMSKIRNEKHKEALKSTIQFASEIGSEIVVFHASKADFNEQTLNTYYYPIYGEKPKEQIFDSLVEQEIIFVRELADYAKELGVTLTVENNWVDNVEVEYTYGMYPETLVEYVKKINKENVGVAYDFGHGYIASKKYNFDFLGAVKCVEPYLRHIHVHDNFGFTDEGEKNIDRIPFGCGDLHMPVGWGEIPYNEIVKIIDSYTGIFTMELQPRFYGYFREALETAKKISKYN